jgi:hypothetical protein
MSIDLEGALADLARSVHDDGATERMNGQVRHMVGRIRRRRAARYSATGVVGAGAVAALAVGGMQLADRFPAAVPPAATDPPATPVPEVSCGAPLPELPGVRDETLVLTGEAGPSAAYGEPVPVTLTLISYNAQTFSLGEKVQLSVVGDGVVVGTSEADPTDLGITGGVDARDPFVTVTACAGDSPLSGGEYQMIARVTLTLADGTTRTVVSDPLPFTITDSPSDEATASEAAVAAIIAASADVSAEYPFGVCGTHVPATASDLLTIDMELDSLSYAPGSLMEGTAAITAIDGLTVLGNSPVTAAHVVLVRDGVVVGRGHYDPEHIALNTFSAAEPYPLPALGNALLCSLPGAPATELELPPGTYQAYATLEVALKEIQNADGSAESRSDLIVARSRPVDVTIG